MRGKERDRGKESFDSVVLTHNRIKARETSKVDSCLRPSGLILPMRASFFFVRISESKRERERERERERD